MAKVNLKKTSGLNLTYFNGSMKFENLTYSKSHDVRLEEMRAQILNEDLQSPEIFYTKYTNVDSEGVFKTKKIKVNLILIPSNVAGIEYVKTRANRCTTHHKIIEIVSGSGVVMIQKFSTSGHNNEIILTKVRNMQKLIIPAGYTYCLINNRLSTLIALEYMSLNAMNKVALDEMKGMAYYVIRKNAKQEIVRNPLYKIVEVHQKVDWEKFYKKCDITPKTPLSRQILRKYEKFEWLLTPAKDSGILFDF
jgi:oxalate decarboxylase/phosphoglucose isomerase-like protein (cupin superfamily)